MKDFRGSGYSCSCTSVAVKSTHIGTCEEKQLKSTSVYSSVAVKSRHLWVKSTNIRIFIGHVSINIIDLQVCFTFPVHCLHADLLRTTNQLCLQFCSAYRVVQVCYAYAVLLCCVINSALFKEPNNRAILDFSSSKETPSPPSS